MQAYQWTEFLFCVHTINDRSATESKMQCIHLVLYTGGSQVRGKKVYEHIRYNIYDMRLERDLQIPHLWSRACLESLDNQCPARQRPHR